MPDYDFQILQPNEFEHFTRDLLQKKEGVLIESFTPGRDRGIDLRFSKVKGNNTIVQAKRYKDYRTLKSVLTKEVPKVKALKPSRYILSTSVGLTPDNKTEIYNLFFPYIKDTLDILGKDELNNLLGRYPDIEKQYYKLWLGSTAVLEDILNKRINNWSAIELEEIRREVSTYVMNESFQSALTILNENRYVIISGIPGIGKTTLARMLVNYLLSEGYEEFVMLETIGDAAQKLMEGRKQVFFFDDFLGSTSFQSDEKGFDHKLVSFIEKVKHEPDKLFILSTREYILAEAKRHFEVFTTSNIEFAKCILDLSHYSESIRAEILYNHLATAELPIPYIQALLAKRNYLKIIKHSNFNPRIIQTFLNKKLYQQVIPPEFVSKFIDFFDRPFSVWELAFCQLSPVAQYSLMIRMSMGEKPVFLSDWDKATKHFIQGTSTELHLPIDSLVWRETLKIIEGTFIHTTRRGERYLVSFQNPSVYDFLGDWIRGLNDIQEIIIRESYYIEQLYNPFSDTGYPSFFGYGRVRLDESVWPALETAYRRHITDIHYCTLNENDTNRGYVCQTIVDFITNMARSFGIIFKSKPSLLSDYVTQEMLENPSYSLMKRMTLLDKMSNQSKSHLDLEHLSVKVLSEADIVDDYVNIMDLLVSTEAGRAALGSSELLKRVEDALEGELESADSADECNRIADCVSALAKSIPSLNESIWDAAISEAMINVPQEPDYDEDFSRDFYTGRSEANDQYDEMFTSLLDSPNGL